MNTPQASANYINQRVWQSEFDLIEEQAKRHENVHDSVTDITVRVVGDHPLANRRSGLWYINWIQMIYAAVWISVFTWLYGSPGNHAYVWTLFWFLIALHFFFYILLHGFALNNYQRIMAAPYQTTLLEHTPTTHFYPTASFMSELQLPFALNFVLVLIEILLYAVWLSSYHSDFGSARLSTDPASDENVAFRQMAAIQVVLSLYHLLAALRSLSQLTWPVFDLGLKNRATLNIFTEAMIKAQEQQYT